MNSRFVRPWAAMVLAAVLGVQALGAAEYRANWSKMKGLHPQSYVASWTDKSLTIDGRLEDPAWKAAPWTAWFRDIEGDARPQPRFRTRAKMTWDNEYFYVAAELEEPHVWGTLTNHDAVIFHDPDFEVFIDPDGDSHDYYEFEMNALNTSWDLILKKPYKDGGPALNSWGIPGLKTAVHVQGTLNNAADKDTGWTLEIALPWNVLGEFANRSAPPAEGDQWRVNFSRVEWLIEIVDGRYQKAAGKKEDNWVWSPQGIIDMHRPEKWGYVQFTRSAPGKVRFQPDPSAPARSVLQEIYYAQREFQKTNQRWAESLSELGWRPDPSTRAPGEPRLKLTAEGFQVTVELRQDDGAAQRWNIRQDAKVWSDNR